MADAEETLLSAYRAFNARDLDAAPVGDTGSQGTRVPIGAAAENR
jgi:hypothetical protein